MTPNCLQGRSARYSAASGYLVVHKSWQTTAQIWNAAARDSRPRCFVMRVFSPSTSDTINISKAAGVLVYGHPHANVFATTIGGTACTRPITRDGVLDFVRDCRYRPSHLYDNLFGNCSNSRYLNFAYRTTSPRACIMVSVSSAICIPQRPVRAAPIMPSSCKSTCSSSTAFQ